MGTPGNFFCHLFAIANLPEKTIIPSSKRIITKISLNENPVKWLVNIKKIHAKSG